MAVLIQAVALGMLVMLAGTLPRNMLFAANLTYLPGLPWAVPLVGVYLWMFWRYLGGWGPPPSTAQQRRAWLRARPLPARVWTWSLVAGGLGIVALVLALRVANRLVELPSQQLPDLSQVPAATVVALLLAAAPVAGIVEEAAFRGYMQGPIEHRYGPVVAIAVTGTLFAVAHLDFTLVLWPYYVAVAAVYGMVTYLSQSILPAVILHTAGNLYSNMDLWLHGQAEWQASAAPPALVWTHGADTAFWWSLGACLLATVAAIGAYVRLATAARMASTADGVVT